MIIFVRYWSFFLRNYDDGGGGGGDDDDNICDLSVFILMMMVLMMMICRNQKMFWEKTRVDETAAAFDIQKERKMGFVSCLY